MARKKPETAEGQSAPEKPKRNYTPADVLSMKLSKRATQIVQALASHYGKKRADVLGALAEATYGQQIEALRNIQVQYESESTSTLAGLFEPQDADPVDVYGGPVTDELGDV